jgi:hypothetical protein
MELLIITSGSSYIRSREGGYITVNLDKASVFPPEQMDAVEQHAYRLKEQGFFDVKIKKLIVTEEDL